MAAAATVTQVVAGHPEHGCYTTSGSFSSWGPCPKSSVVAPSKPASSLERFSGATGVTTYMPYIGAAVLAAGGGFAGHHFGKGKMLWTVIGAVAGGAIGYFVGKKI